MKNKETLISYWTDYLVRKGMDKYHAKETAMIIADEIEEVYSKAIGNSAGVFVKARERMPLAEGYYNGKRLGEPIALYARKNNKEEMYFSTSNGMQFKGWKDFLWLDESIHKEDKPIDKVSEAVKFKDWCDKNTYELETREERLFTTKELYEQFKSTK